MAVQAVAFDSYRHPFTLLSNLLSICDLLYITFKVIMAGFHHTQQAILNSGNIKTIKAALNKQKKNGAKKSKCKPF